MRKRTILALIAIFVFASVVKASPVDPQSAIQVAKQFVPKSTTARRAPMRGSKTEPSSSIVYTHMMPNSDRPAFYIVNVDDGAFVLVSADDIAHQVLGYSLSSAWPVAKDGSVELPEHIKGFFDDLAAQMEAAVEAEPTRASGSYKASPRSSAPNRSPSLPDSVGPLLTTAWDQGQYYNALCPEDANGPDGHVYTGCVATAMAQIVKYWSDSTPGRGTHSYSTDYGTLTVNYAEASYDYANMPNVLDENSTQAQINAVAQLIYHCGVATNMEYGASESSSFDRDARAGLINFFRFSPNMSYAERAYFTNTEWNNILRENIAANHPVLYSGFGISGGHSFVCDGYKAGDYYHFNFGWGGLADGWYLTNAVTPNSMNFSSAQSAIVGIVPDNDSEVIIGQMYGHSTFIVDEPLRYYNIMGRNLYYNGDGMNECNNTVSFISSDDSKSIVLDIINFEDQLVNIYEGTNTNTRLRSLYGGNDNDLSPVVSNGNSITLNYIGNFSYLGFDLCISQNSENRMVSNITSSVNGNSVELSWKENGNATSWQVEYGQTGFTIGEGTQLTANDTTIIINELTRYIDYDFYIRPQSGGNWYGPIRLQPMPNYWIDVVDSQPDGYSVGELDDNGRYPITITTAEGLAWWAKQVINQGSTQPIAHTTVNLAADIDLGQYRWKSIPEFYGNFNGNGHTISNMHIIEDGVNSENAGYGFFRYYRGYTEYDRQIISNLYFQDPYIKIRKGSLGIYFNSDGYLNAPTTYYLAGSGILAGRINFATIENCGVNNATINQNFFSSTMYDGLLVGLLEESDICNSYASGSINSVSSIVGGLIGYITGYIGGKGNNITNCYSSVNINAFSKIGSICGYTDDVNIKNCYGINNVALINFDSNSNSVITDTMRFDNETLLLSESIILDGIKYDDLMSALNATVKSENSNSLRSWVADNNVINNGLPILGDYFEVLCPNAENVVAVNIKTNTGYATHVTWNNDPYSSSWRIKYWEVDSLEKTARYLTTETNEIDINNIILGRVYNICVQQIYDETHRSGWGSPIQIMYDKPYWTDIVTSRPEGYLEDSDGNVTISSAEGLAWFSCIVNGLNNQEHKTFRSKTVTLLSDIDLSEYKWKPIGYSAEYTFQGCFNGNNHIISNMYIRENHECIGLFGRVYQHDYTIPTSYKKFSNIILSNSIVYGESYTGGILGDYWSSFEIEPILLFDNCHVRNITIYGNSSVGGLAGYISQGVAITTINCSSSGLVHGNGKVGGLIGSISNGSNDLIANCFSTCNIFATEDNEIYGGLIGWAKDCSIQNGYAKGNINATCVKGNLFGFLCSDITCKYLYCLRDDSSTPLIGWSEELSTISISDTATFSDLGLLNVAITIGNNKYSNIVDVLNAWVDVYDTLGVYRHWAIDSINEIGGYPVFATPQKRVITLTVNENTPYGTVKGSGSYSELENKVTIYANPNEGYHFKQWSDGNTENPRILKLTHDISLTASFDVDLYSIVGGENVDISYEFDFENCNDDLQWTILNGNFENRWYINKLEGDNRAAFISNLNGEKNDYYGNDARSKVYLYTTIELISGQYNYSYDWRCNGDFHNDYLQIALIPDSDDPSSWDSYFYLPTNAIAMYEGNQLINQSEWTHQIGTITVPTDGQYKMIIMWVNDFTQRYAPPAAIDNIVIKSITPEGESHGTVYGSDTVQYLETVVLTAVPDEGFQFISWNDGNTDNPRTITAVSNVTYKASFDTLRCAITFQNSDSTVLQIDTLAYGKLPFYRGNIPTKQPTAEYSYTFTNWTPAICQVTDNALYTATYDSVVNKYILTYKVDGADYKKDTLAYNTAITPLAALIKVGYTFIGWSDIPATMPAQNVEVTGSFTVNKYRLTVLVADTVYCSDSIAYGTKLADYFALIEEKGIDLSQWEFYDMIETITMPARDIKINAIVTNVRPIRKYVDESAIYDLIGRKIETDDISTLPSGIYIRNGRKFMVP